MAMELVSSQPYYFDEDYPFIEPLVETFRFEYSPSCCIWEIIKFSYVNAYVANKFYVSMMLSQEDEEETQRIREMLFLCKMS